ncbi:unnamed protein product [Brassica oleracea]
MSNNENIDDVGAGAEDGGGTTRRKEIQYAKKIRENGIPHMELMRRIFGRFKWDLPRENGISHMVVNQKLFTQLMSKMQSMLNKMRMSSWISLFQKPKIMMETIQISFIQLSCITTHKTISLDSPPRSPIGPSKR